MTKIKINKTTVNREVLLKKVIGAKNFIKEYWGIIVVIVVLAWSFISELSAPVDDLPTYKDGYADGTGIYYEYTEE